jgi:hypothetical protein
MAIRAEKHLHQIERLRASVPRGESFLTESLGSTAHLHCRLDDDRVQSPLNPACHSQQTHHVVIGQVRNLLAGERIVQHGGDAGLRFLQTSDDAVHTHHSTRGHRHSNACSHKTLNLRLNPVSE